MWSVQYIQYHCKNGYKCLVHVVRGIHLALRPFMREGLWVYIYTHTFILPVKANIWTQAFLPEVVRMPFCLQPLPAFLKSLLQCISDSANSLLTLISHCSHHYSIRFNDLICATTNLNKEKTWLNYTSFVLFERHKGQIERPVFLKCNRAGLKYSYMLDSDPAH